MGEIKSAWEIALEKVEKLGKLSPEEIRRQREERCTSIGQALASKYLSGLDLWQLEVELDKYEGEERELVRKVVVAKLVQSIELGNHQLLEKVLGGVFHLRQEGGMEKTREEFEQLFDEYEQMKRKRGEEIERSAKEMLHQLRISGSAIEAINPRAREEWQLKLNELAQPFNERLEELKQALLVGKAEC